MAQTGKETFGLKVMSANGVFFDGRAESVTIPCKDGSMQILAHHEEMIVAIYQGDMKIVSAD
ncbi:MAG: ATP synthase F1 subunit epsilon, partial [Lachnospiraceae bacterium]|nr:ATP synthase F1 subunit epsilon [Lachnospiraceae bacterium]